MNRNGYYNGCKFGAWASLGRGRDWDVGEFLTWANLGRGRVFDVGEFGTWASLGHGRVWDVGEFRTWTRMDVNEFERGGNLRLLNLDVGEYPLLSLINSNAAFTEVTKVQRGFRCKNVEFQRQTLSYTTRLNCLLSGLTGLPESNPEPYAGSIGF